MVLLFHTFEAIAFAGGYAEQDIYHGFLGVDFFFVLSGFVMGYAYDDRWNNMSVIQFVRRRLIRLHPMVVIGVIIGFIAFLISGRTNWDGKVINFPTVLTTTFFALFIIPVLSKNLDVRGNTEMFPLNGPHWSLFFEYIGSLLYALVIHRISTKAFKIWVIFIASMLLINAILFGNNSIAYGWSYEPYNIYGGALRLLFAYPAGLLLARIFSAKEIINTKKPVFILSTILLVLLLSAPSISTLTGWTRANSIYQFVCVVFCFPLIVIFAARGTVDGWKKKIISYLGRLSYPLYAIHYPLIYLYIYWIKTDQHPFGQGTFTTPVFVAIINILIAVLCLHLFDEPIRRYLTKKIIK